MSNPKDIIRPDFKQHSTESKEIFTASGPDYKTMALTLIEFNKAIYALADNLRDSLLTYSRLSTKKQNKG